MTIQELLSTYERIAITGYPDAGKTTVARTIADRLVLNTGTAAQGGDGHTPESVTMEDLASWWVAALDGVPRFCLEGVFVPRVVRRAIRENHLDLFDCVLWIKPHQGWAPDKRRASFRKAIDTVYRQAFDLSVDRRAPVKFLTGTAEELLGQPQQ